MSSDDDEAAEVLRELEMEQTGRSAVAPAADADPEPPSSQPLRRRLRGKLAAACRLDMSHG